MSGRTSITTSDREWDPTDFTTEQPVTYSGNTAEILTGVYVRLTIAQKKTLLEESQEKQVSMSSIIRDLLDDRENK